MKNNWNDNLTPEQNYILKNEGTEPPGSSELNNEKRDGSYHCANCGVKLFDSKTKYESGSGWPSFFQSLQMYLKLKLIIYSVMLVQNTIVKIVMHIMVMFLMIDLNRLIKVTVIMVFV